MSSRLTILFTFSVLSAQTIERVWTRPEACVRGKPVEFAVLGSGFDPSTVTASYFGEGECQKGCPLPLDDRKFAGVLTGRVRIDGAGDYSVEVRNGEGKPSNPARLCSVSTPRIAQVLTRPDPPQAGQKVEFFIAGSGFDAETATVTINNIPMATRARSFGAIAAEAVVSAPGQYTIAVMNTGDTNMATHTLEVPAPRILAFVAHPEGVMRDVAFPFVLSGTNLAAGQTKLLLFRPSDCEKGCAPDNLEVLHSSSTLLTGKMTVRNPGQFAIGVESAGHASPLHPEILFVK